MIGSPAVDGHLRDALDILEREIKLSFNCHAVAKVESFNPSNQTVQASILYKRTSLDESGNEIHEDYPVLADVPAVIMSGGPAGLTFPIAAGDECLILFNDRDIDAWFSSGQNAVLESARLHSMADGVALIGIRSANRQLSTYDGTRAVLFNGTTMVGVGSSLVKIANATSTLGVLLQNLLTTLQALTVVTASPGNPSPVSPTTIAALQTIGTQLTGLLE